MTFTAVGSFLQAAFSGSGTLSLNNQAIGNLLMVAATTTDSSNYVSSVSGGGATWTQIGTHHPGTTNPNAVATLWQGSITATGAQTLTLTVTAGGPDIRVAGFEFHSTVGSWAVDAGPSYLDVAGTSTWPSLTPAGTGELYFGFALNSGTASAGSTAGYSYNVTSQGNGEAHNVTVSAASAPVWADSGQAFGPVVLIKETGGAATPPPVSLVAVNRPALIVSNAGWRGSGRSR